MAIVFNYEAFRFEAWLAGGNRKVQQQYWELVRNSQWPAYRVVTPAKGVDSIIECNLAKDFDFADLGGPDGAYSKRTRRSSSPTLSVSCLNTIACEVAKPHARSYSQSDKDSGFSLWSRGFSRSFQATSMPG